MARFPNSTRTFSPEEQLLLACARVRVEEETADCIRALVAGPMEWPALIEGAAAHNLSPLVFRHLLELCPENLPAEVRARFEKGFQGHERWTLYLTAELFRLLDRFREQGILAIPYKGPVLAAQAYGDVMLRQFADLDIAVRQRDMPRAHQLLIADGYKSSYGPLLPGEAEKTQHSEYQYIRSPGRAIVELQTDATLRYFPRPLDLDAIASRLVPFAFAGGEVKALSAADTLLLLSVHGTKHYWERLLWTCDIAELARRNERGQLPGGIPWDEAFSRAAELRVGRMLRLALWVARHFLDAPLPEPVLRKVEADPVVRGMGEEIWSRFSLQGEARVAALPRFWFRVRSGESFWQGLRYAGRIAILPTNPDRADAHLPQRFSAAHAVLRPFLLLRRYGFRRWKSQDAKGVAEEARTREHQN
ncbi:MAG: nucleotidyltransferase family protein [Candidatus Acidiferrales bacterium]